MKDAPRKRCARSDRQAEPHEIGHETATPCDQASAERPRRVGTLASRASVTTRLTGMRLCATRRATFAVFFLLCPPAFAQTAAPAPPARGADASRDEQPPRAGDASGARGAPGPTGTAPEAKAEPKVATPRPPKPVTPEEISGIDSRARS